MPKLQNELTILQQGNFEMIIVDNAANYKEIKIPNIKRKHGHPSNSKHICSTFKNIVKKPKVKKLNNNDATMPIKLDSCIHQSIVSEIYNPLGDSYCSFRLLAVAIFQEEKKWQNIKNTMISQLTKNQSLYSNTL
ncbi:2449_t:CDS:2 [Dentiscutata erythropus]|uniref:2449_t:CDS:1 n=1 Tax=Dentiscutata erythropus TaxID=1348616 RepID=A0A9N9AVC5_9GLOM|nr:2449_t:CDS:2 [Dentiscutata erythropus]